MHPGAHMPAQHSRSFMAIIGFHHTAMSTPNLERLSSFYQKCFGFEPVCEFSWEKGVEPYDRMMALKDTAAQVVMLRTGNAFLEIFQFSSPLPRPQEADRPVVDHGLTHICIVV